MKNLRRNFERFCYNHRDKGIANLMLFVAIGNVIVYFFTLIDQSQLIYSYLYFDRGAILRGQVWRLVTYVFTYLNDGGGFNTLLTLVMLFCYYQIGRMLEQQWGVLRFNLYYLGGILLMDVGALLLGCNATTAYLNLTLFLAIATLLPELRFLLFFVIPIKAKYFAWFYFGLTILQLLQGLRAMLHMLGGGVLYLEWLFPVIALANYFLFFGKDVTNVLPDQLRYRRVRQKKPKSTQPGPDWAKNYRNSSGQPPYRHKCTVCGRTDAQYPALEFRYCSHCNGYYCYCEDHINNHVHIT